MNGFIRRSNEGRSRKHSGTILRAAVIVGLLTFVIMPRYTRLVRRWLYEESE
jgi:antibiotic biosynthesis monooxygenase (ABM) superfamily enzyme